MQAASASSRSPAKSTRALAWAALALATVVAYRTVLDAGFLWWDDAVYVTENARVQAGLVPSTVAWAFTSGDAANWHPITWLSHALDVSLFGESAAGHHATSLAIHVANVFLLGRLVERWTGRFAVAWLVAAVLALHPLHVESVAWVAERKDVLSQLFLLLSLGAWTSFVERGGARRYVAALVLYALGLMSKPMLVTAPFLLLVLDAWPFGRVRGFGGADARRARPLAALVVEKAPFFALALASCVVTYLVQRAGGAVQAELGPTIAERCGNAIASIARYAGHALWPAELSPFYVRRSPFATPAFVIGCALLAVVLVLAWRWRARRPWFAAGWAWFVGTLVPVLGLVQVGDQAMADRYTYVPLTGLVLVVVLGARELASWLGIARVAFATALAIVAALGVTTARQVAWWHDDVALFGRALATDHENHVAYMNLGKALAAQKRWDEARASLRRATELEPRYIEAWMNLGAVLGASGRPDLAIPALERAAELAPWIPDVQFNLGLAYAATKRDVEADARFRRTLELVPDHFGAHGNLGLAARARGDLATALEHFRAAHRARPDDRGARRWLALTLLDTNAIEEALRDHADVLRADAKDREHAIELTRRAIERARSSGRSTEAESLQRALDSFTSNR